MKKLKALLQASSLIQDLGFDTLNSLLYWRHNLRGNKIRKNYFVRASKLPPIILLQGFMGTRGVLLPLENHLRASGRDVISIDFGFFNVSDIKGSAQLLSYKIERLLDRFSGIHNIQKIQIIGHSMGGLIGLYYVKKLGGHRIVDKLITLGAPFNGTWTSLLGLFPFGVFSKGIWQMLPTSDFLKKLQKKTSEVYETEVISISAKYDSICPPKTCHLPGATNEILNVGHASLLMDKKVFDAIDRHLQEKESSARVVPIRK
ncbi:MAG: lipase class 2 [Bacteriovoracaceae bacterium]|nr:lipase class 2 [Bacteriovoracaceae bacterium]